MTTLTEIITGNFTQYEIEYRIHATRRMFQRNIKNEEIEFILENGQVIERYDNDYPLPSVLLNSQTKNGRFLHVVVGINFDENKLIIITTYEPNPILWTENFSRRL